MKGVLSMVGFTYLLASSREPTTEEVADRLMDMILYGELTAASK